MTPTTINVMVALAGGACLWRLVTGAWPVPVLWYANIAGRRLDLLRAVLERVIREALDEVDREVQHAVFYYAKPSGERGIVAASKSKPAHRATRLSYACDKQTELLSANVEAAERGMWMTDRQLAFIGERAPTNATEAAHIAFLCLEAEAAKIDYEVARLNVGILKDELTQLQAEQ